MSNKFVANPAVLKSIGNTIHDQGQQFGQNVEKVYTTVEEMVSTDYLSPAANAIAAEIQSYKGELDKMTKVINDYGEYCLHSSNTVDRNEQNIIDSVNMKNNTTDTEY